MAHDRKLVLSGVALTMARNNPCDIEVMAEAMDDVEQPMISTGYLGHAPFQWVGLILRYGLKNEDEPHYQRIDKKHGDLPVAIELDTHGLRHATREELKAAFTIATLKVLIHVAKSYELPCDKFCRHVEAGENFRRTLRYASTSSICSVH